MLAIYKRHSDKCPQQSRSYRRCNCPCWVEGTVEGKYFRESLKTRNWTRASEIVRERENGKEQRRITISDATEAFVRDAEARGLRPPSIYKYKLLFKQLAEFTADKGLSDITECDIESLRSFRESWKNKNFSAGKKLEALRTFFKFVHESGWLPTNPAKVIKPPKTDDPPTMPYSQEEFKRVLDACDNYPNKRSAVRLRALTLLLRYSGLRITDAVTLTKHQISNDLLTLRTAKTGTDVRVPLPKTVLAALLAIETDNYYFWSGRGTKKSCLGDYQRAFKHLYKIAQVENGHAHRWRDTFAVELLLSGMPLEQVGALLGHQSIKVTQKHYSPWVKARQEQLEAAVRRTF
jgi:integrase/recombinase XerD